MVGREFAEFLGEQAGAGAGHGRDAAQVEDDELRPRLGRDLPRDVIDIGERQRADQLDDANVLVMRGEDVLFVCAPHAPRRAVADVVIGDDAVARVVAAVEHMQVVMRRQRLADLDAAHAVAVLVELRRIAAEPEPRRQRRKDAAADAALGGDADPVDPFAGVVVHAGARHDGERPRDGISAQHLFAGHRIDAAVGEGGRHDRDIARRHQDGALPEIDLQHRRHVVLDHGVGAQQIADRPVAVAGQAFGSNRRRRRRRDRARQTGPAPA